MRGTPNTSSRRSHGGKPVLGHPSSSFTGSEAIEPLTFPGIADRLVGLLDRLELPKAHLVGLSFGGMHALHTAIAHPDRVDRLVLADTNGHP